MVILQTQPAFPVFPGDVWGVLYPETSFWLGAWPCPAGTGKHQEIRPGTNEATEISLEHQDTLFSEFSPEECDKNFLFPRKNMHSQFEEDRYGESQRSDCSPNYDDLGATPKIFSIQRIPKVAFQMISREDLAKKQDSLMETKPQVIPKVTLETSNVDRSKIFKGVREDLYFKAICRDIRKFIQEQFQSFLGEIDCVSMMKSKSLVQHIENFYNQVVCGRNQGTTMDEKELAWLGTFVSSHHFQVRTRYETKKLSKQIHSILLKFTKSKLKWLMSLPDFRMVVQYYYKTVAFDQDYSRFKNHKTMRKNLDGYKFALKEMNILAKDFPGESLDNTL